MSQGPGLTVSAQLALSHGIDSSERDTWIDMDQRRRNDEPDRLFVG